MENNSNNEKINFDINALLKSASENPEDDQSLEILKLTKDDAHVYKMPPMSSAEGHTTDEFKDLVFRGKMKIFIKGNFVIIYFLNENNTVFLVSFVDENIEKYVTRARDSTRYFSFRAMNEKGEAGIYGLVFKQRNDAFDFYTTLCDFREKLQFERKSKTEEYKPKYDFSLKAEKPSEEKKGVNLNRDEKYFSDMTLSMNESDISKIYNLNCIKKKIQKFYKEIINVEFEEDFFEGKIAIESNSEQQFKYLAELLTGLAAQCEKRGEFLHIMQNMDEEDSNELLTILKERITDYTDKNKTTEGNKIDDSYEDEDNAALYFKIENLENENLKLHDQIEDLNRKINDLNKINYNYELNNKELEAKYQELIHTFDQRNNQFNNNQQNIEENLQMSIQLSELRGKLDAKEKNLAKFKEEKEKIIDEYKSKVSSLQSELEILREKGVKYEILKEKMDKFPIEDVGLLKTKLVNSERRITELEEINKKLKNYDVDKAKILKKIEELNYELIQEREKNSDLIKENNYYKDMVLQNENDIKFLKKELERLRSINDSTSKEDNIDSDKKVSLFDIENDQDTKKQLIDLDTKLKMSIFDKESLSKDKKELEELVQKLTDEINTKNSEIEKLKKKGDKYTKYKEERHTFLSKISDLMDKVHEYKIETENQKLEKVKEKQEAETNYNNQISIQTQKHSEEIFGLKETINKYENENNFLKKEIQKTEDLLESNKLYINELNKKMSNPNSDNKLEEMENRLKGLIQTENLENKKTIREKEEIISNLNQKIKLLESSLKKISGDFDILSKKSMEFSSDEVKKKDEAINYYKNLLESQEKAFNQEQQLLSTVLHQLALQFNSLQSKSVNKDDAAWSLDK